jgi:hypothetical protein
MANELDEILKHAGVKGMKWGHHKDQIKGAMKSYAQKRVAKQKAVLDEFHSKTKSDKVYMHFYKGNLQRTNNHYKAVKAAKQELVKRREAAMAVMGLMAAPYANDAINTINRNRNGF